MESPDFGKTPQELFLRELLWALISAPTGASTMWWVPEVCFCELMLSDLLSPSILKHAGLPFPGLSLEGTMLTDRLREDSLLHRSSSEDPRSSPRPAHHTTH